MIIRKIQTNKIPRCLNKSQGFVMLFAVTISSILLAIALGVANIALKEVRFSTSARDTNDAFLAADTGIEYTLMNDKNPATYPGTGSWTLTLINLGGGTSPQGCAKVTITKAGSPVNTTIVSKGYNVGDGSCNSTNPNRIERLLQASY